MPQQHNIEICREGLIRNKDLDEVGNWLISGEDTDGTLRSFGKYIPLAVITDVSYGYAVETALKTPGFFTWGFGGIVTKIKVITD